MGIFWSKKNKSAVAPETKKLAVVAEKPAAVFSDTWSENASKVLLRPRVTEKASTLSVAGRNVYIFEVSRFADKRKVAEAVRSLYKVSPEKVAILRVPPKRSFVKGKMSKGKTGYKAYVYLKKGDKIEV